MRAGRIFMTSQGNAAVSPVSLLSSLVSNQRLIFQLARREVSSRYKGSVLGMVWSLFTPVFMLAVYTFVFSAIFKSRWGGGGGNENRAQFALILFTGMIMLNFFNEVLNRAPALIIANVNYVKKVIFPLEILPVVATASALFNALVSLIVLLAAFFVFNSHLHWTVIFIFPVLLPLVILTLGLAFAVIAHVGADILVVDEALAIVETFFQRKCRQFLRGFQGRGGTASFVSYDAGAVAALCDSTVLLSRVRYYTCQKGKTEDICRIYLNELYQERAVSKDVAAIVRSLKSRLVHGVAGAQNLVINLSIESCEPEVGS